MASIYEIGQEFQTLWQLMEDGILDDDTIAGAFDVAKEDLADKLEGYCKFLKNLESDIAGLKAEEERLKARRQTMENTVKRSKDAMQAALNKAGEKKIPCGSFVVSIQTNPPKLIMDADQLAKIPGKYLIPQEPQVDKKAMLEDLKAEGDEAKALEGIAHIERGESLRIK